jgi:integrase
VGTSVGIGARVTGDTNKMLSDTRIRGAKPTDRPVKLSDGGGLYLMVTPSGARCWRYNYRFCDKQKTLSLGLYPDVSLARARACHLEARQQLAQGIDPSAEKQVQGKTFEVVARAWYARWSPNRHAQYAFYVLKRLEEDVLPKIGSMSVSEVPTSAFRDVVRRIEARGAGEIAKRVLQNCNQIMRYAVAHDLAVRNPVADVRPADILNPRKRRNYPRVSEKELPGLLLSIDRYLGGEHTRLAMQLMALTFVRTTELVGARWAEFDMKGARWDIPAERMKMKSPHIVALSKQALAVLNRLQEISFSRELVFPGDVNPAKHMSTNTILFALYRMGYRGRMTGHGFRGVASTILHEQGCSRKRLPRKQVRLFYKKSTSGTEGRDQRTKDCQVLPLIYMDQHVPKMNEVKGARRQPVLQDVVAPNFIHGRLQQTCICICCDDPAGSANPVSQPAGD